MKLSRDPSQTASPAQPAAIPPLRHLLGLAAATVAGGLATGWLIYTIQLPDDADAERPPSAAAIEQVAALQASRVAVNATGMPKHGALRLVWLQGFEAGAVAACVSPEGAQ